MFQNLSEKVTSVSKNLGRHRALTEQDVTAALREIRVALLDADVALPVVKTFMDGLKKKQSGKKLLIASHPPNCHENCL